MLNFYKKATLVFLILLILSLFVAYLCIERTFLNDVLLPARQSIYPWTMVTDSDALSGGSSSVSVNDSTYVLDFNMHLTKDMDYPYASLRFTFVGLEDETRNVYFSNYSTVSFNVKCSPANMLTFSVYALDEEVTAREGAPIYRIANSFFSCDEEWEHVEIDLTHLEVPGWWLGSHNVDLTDRVYSLDKVSGFAIGSSWNSPKEVSLDVNVTELTLNGRDWRFMYALGVFLFLLWSGYALWLVRQYIKQLIADIKDKRQKDRSLITYQQLSVEPQRDKDRKLILGFMATEYADPDLSLETMVTTLGVSRTKVNDVLKEETGYTFTSYLNKLRLTEAARLLSEKEEANIAEIAYSVGYKNVPYFNKLFKNEYGCTPKTFKNIYKQ